MSAYVFEIHATRKQYMKFDQNEIFAEYIAANSEGEAHGYVISRLHSAGWRINSIRCEEFLMTDIRDGREEVI